MSKIYVFDLDGTLANSINSVRAGISKYLNKRGVEMTDELFKNIITLGYPKTAEYFINVYNINENPSDIVNELYDNLTNEYAHNIFLKPYAKEYLLKLKNEDQRLFILSASPHVFIDPCLKNNGVYECFEKMLSVDDIGYTKSTTILFEKVAHMLNVNPSDIVYFEDSYDACVNAKKVGYVVYGVDDVQPKEWKEALKQAVDYYVTSYKDLI